MRFPRDRTPYARHPDSRLLDASIADGPYVYVEDTDGVIRVLPDGPHRHPRVLGNASPVEYAGDMTIEDGRVIDLTNLSGTFLFDDEDGLLRVADEIRRLGVPVESNAIRFFPVDGSEPRVIG